MDTLEYQALAARIAERTIQLSTENEHLRRANEELTRRLAGGKQTEDALKRCKERSRAFLDASPDDITITDLEGHIVMVSPVALIRFRGKKGEAYMGRPFTDFIISEDRSRAWSQIARKRRGDITGPSEYRALRADGSRFDIEVNSEFLRDVDGTATGMVFIVRDITERKQMEADKHSLEAQNRQLQKTESLGRMAAAIAHTFNNQLGIVMGSWNWP